MGRGCVVVRLLLRRLRCNTPTTRCGSRLCWGMRAMAGAYLGGSYRTGVVGYLDCRGRSRCPAVVGGLRERAIAVGGLWFGLLRSWLGGWWGSRRGGGRARFWWLRAGWGGWWCGGGHCDRQPDSGAHGPCAGGFGRVFCQHAGAAHGHVGPSELW